MDAKGSTNVGEVQVLNNLLTLNQRPITILVPNERTIKTESNLSTPSQKIPRPANAFMIFANENRKKVAKEYPQESNKEISCRLGAQWKKLSSKEKEKYYSMAKVIDADHKKKYPDYVYNPKEARIRKAMRERERSIGAAQMGAARSRRSNWPKSPLHMQGPGPSNHPDHLLGAPSKDLCSALRAEMEHGFLAGNGGYVYPSQQYQFSPQSDYAAYIQVAPGLSNWVQNQYNMQQQGNALAQQQIWNQYQSERLRAQQNAGSPYLMNSQPEPPEYRNVEHMPPANIMQMRPSPPIKPTIHQNLQNATSEVERYMNIPNSITPIPTTSSAEVRLPVPIPDNLRTSAATPRSVATSPPIVVATERVEEANPGGEVDEIANNGGENNAAPELNISSVSALSEIDAQINNMETTANTSSESSFRGLGLFDDGNLSNVGSDIHKELNARRNTKVINLAHSNTIKSEMESLQPIFPTDFAPGRPPFLPQNNYIMDYYVPELQNPYPDPGNIILNKPDFPGDFSAQKYYESVSEGNFDGPLFSGEHFGSCMCDESYGFLPFPSPPEMVNPCAFTPTHFEMPQFLNDPNDSKLAIHNNFILDLSMSQNEEDPIDVEKVESDTKIDVSSIKTCS